MQTIVINLKLTYEDEIVRMHLDFANFVNRVATFLQNRRSRMVSFPKELFTDENVKKVIHSIRMHHNEECDELIIQVDEKHREEYPLLGTPDNHFDDVVYAIGLDMIKKTAESSNAVK